MYFYNKDHLVFSELIVIPILLIPYNKSIYVDPSKKEVQDLISKENSGKSGIYLWHNNLTGEQYVGQAQDLGSKQSGRVFRYLRPAYLTTTPAGASRIHSALNKYGLSNFSLIILEQCDTADITRQEQYWMDLLKPAYNILMAGKSSVGYIHTTESRAKM